MLFAAAPTLNADGFIVVDPHGHIPHPQPLPMPPRPPFNPFPLQVKYHHVDVNIQDLVALTSIDQVFYNPTAQRLEGYYIFPIPQNAVIKKFTMNINGKEMEAEMLDAEKARKIYEDIVRKQLDPALLEYMGRGLFKVRIFPIEPYSEKRIKISYREILEKENGSVEYIYPLNTEKFSSKPLNDVAISVRIQTSENIKNIYCPTHKTQIIQKNPKLALVGFEERNTAPDTDFKLYFGTDQSQLGFSLLTYKKEGEDGFFLLSVSPGYETQKDKILPKDIAFVLDVSGSMAGKKLDQAKKALLFCIDNLNKGDRFEIIRFSTEAEPLFGRYTQVSSDSISKARQFIDNLRPIGGTNIDDALTKALAMERQSQRPNMIIFLTDGKPTIGETDEEQLLAKIQSSNSSKTRIFTFGIGNEINTHLLDKITESTRAYRTYISENEDIEIKVSQFYTNVQSPVLTDLKLDFGNSIRVSKLYPTNLPDLFKGSTLTLLGRYQGQGKTTITLTGKVEGTQKQFSFTPETGFIADKSDDALRNDFLPPLWAARRVGYLLDQVRLHGKDKELVDEITQLARTYGIITPYTSYLILEDEQQNVNRQVLREEFQTLGNISRTDPDFRTQTKKEYSQMKARDGAAGVQASRDVQQLNAVENVKYIRPGESRMNFKSAPNNVQNVNAMMKTIQGRTFYNTSNNWVDAGIQQQKSSRINRIQFGGTEYFKLLQKEPSAAQFMSLGKNVSFVLKNNIYVIYE